MQSCTLLGAYILLRLLIRISCVPCIMHRIILWLGQLAQQGCVQIKYGVQEFNVITLVVLQFSSLAQWTSMQDVVHVPETTCSRTMSRASVHAACRQIMEHLVWYVAGLGRAGLFLEQGYTSFSLGKYTGPMGWVDFFDAPHRIFGGGCVFVRGNRRILRRGKFTS